jgi:hypothetical protein
MKKTYLILKVLYLDLHFYDFLSFFFFLQSPHNYVNVQIVNQHRLSGQSYESGVSSRQSYHSTSSSSVGSLDRLEETGPTSNINVAELFHSGMQVR